MNLNLDGMAISNAIQIDNTQFGHQLAQYSTSVAAVENTNQRYWQAEANRQHIWNNEVSKYNSLINAQNSLLHRINDPEIRLWRYQKQLYYRTNNGQLISANQIEIQKELSSRYGCNVRIYNDINDVLQNNNENRINTFPITINSLPIIEEELFNPNTKYELFQDYNGVWKRNLLADTRYQKKNCYLIVNTNLLPEN
ncbi:MAG: hypothetical protein PHN18_01855 [Sulfurospirillaceae bacterium]|nr:hypothetical protein [Sulfurospirillaceae bacterium]MDD2826536.1 hypothetical protein [Sulfurospirillaceae bacterium]